MLEWYFKGFADELSPQLRHITPLPKKPSYYMTQYGVNYNPEWPIRVNIDHILGDAEQPDLAMTLTIMDGYYLGNTCLTLEMAYLNARLLSKPVASWLSEIVE